MDAELRAQLAFRATGKRIGLLEPVAGAGLSPALFSGFRDLSRLRYDFPIVLIETEGDPPWLGSLTGVVDAILQSIAPCGAAGERTRRQVLNLEQAIRDRVARGASGRLTALWDQSASALTARSNEELSSTLAQARLALGVDGEVIDCDAAAPARVITHVWRQVQRRKLSTLSRRIEQLVRKLSDALAADAARSSPGRSPAALAAGLGPVLGESFDFAAMSRILTTAASKHPFPEGRRRRIERTLEVLRSQTYLESPGRSEGGGTADPLDGFLFTDCARAITACRARLAGVVELTKAMAIAELEIEGRYVEAEHDAFFAAFDRTSLGGSELAHLPDILVVVSTGGGAEQHAAAIEVLSSGLPIKLLVLADDILGEPTQGELTLTSARLATMAVGFNDIYVLQASASQLYAQRARIERGLEFPGATLFSMFSGADDERSYLTAAAATEARAFPSFCYDPSAGTDFAARFSLDGNPQPEADWPRHDLTYEEGVCQRVASELSFTFVDFVAADRRYAHHLASVPEGKANGELVPVDEWLDAAPGDAAETVPYILMVDWDNRLHHSIPDEALTVAARRCRDLWRRLQELGGIHSSHAAIMLAKERQAWEEQRQREEKAAQAEKPPPAAASSVVVSASAAATPTSLEAAQAEPPEAKASDDPYIETLRCTSCNECTQINGRMFAYNANKQAYIADADAGTYRELVEAAEACQVSIIHPGKPRNPNEANLEELLKRAEALR